MGGAQGGSNNGTYRGYRPDIDGVRALAVLAVCAFHAFPETLRGGYVGVDVFFVISGFLITGLILDGRDAGRFSLRAFYLRRIRRIFPALIVVLAATLVLGWLLLMPDEYEALGRHVIAASLFGSNFILWSEAGYFGNESAVKPLLHLWSLGVEEQFYLLWPATLMAVVSFSKRPRLIVAGIAAASFALNVYEVVDHPTATFYAPITRLWELLAGALMALGAREKSTPRLPSLQADLSAAAGLLLIGAAMVLFTKDTVFPGWNALVPTAGTALVISAGPAARINRRWLSYRPLVFIGLISYPLYLWHWPLLVFQASQLAYDADIVRLGKTLALLIAGMAAVLTYRYVELPARRFSLKTIGASTSALLLTVGAAGVLPLLNDGFPDRFPAFMSANPEGWLREIRDGTCHLESTTRRAEECVEPTRPLVFLWGDSYASALYPGLKALQAHRHFGIAQMTQAACRPYLFDRPATYRADCDAINATVLSRARALQPETIMLHGAWQQDARTLSAQDISARILATVDALKQQLPAARIMVIGPPPQWKLSLKRSMFLYWRTSGEMPPQYMRFMLDDGTAALDATMSRELQSAGVGYASLYDALCNERGCRTAEGERHEHLTAVDYGHLSVNGATFAARQIEGRLFPETARGATVGTPTRP